jgi:hypothetical protein
MKVGLTGHQDIGSKSDIDWVKDSLIEQIEKYKVSLGISCLAVGADQLYAELLHSKVIPFIVIIPSFGYEKTFDEKTELLNYNRLLLTAQDIVRMDFPFPSEEAFYAAGKEVVNQSNMLFAIWNGKKAKGLGGTGDIVNFAKQHSKKIIHINPINRTIKQI